MLRYTKFLTISHSQLRLSKCLFHKSIRAAHHVALVGPPEIYQTPPTEDRSPTSGNPCLDFFLHAVPGTPPETLLNLLRRSWSYDPLKALKLFCNLRGVRGTGKSDKEGFYTAALWLHEHHPRTLAANVAAFAQFGYFKDLLEILFRLLEGADARKLAKENGENWKAYKKADFQWRQGWGLKEEVIASWKRLHAGQTLSREEKRIEKGKRVVERFNHDPQFRSLHEQISDLFARETERNQPRSEMVPLSRFLLRQN